MMPGAVPPPPRVQEFDGDLHVPLGVAVLPPFEPEEPPSAPLPPAGIPQRDARPLNLVQVTRRDSIRLALQYYKEVCDDEEVDDVDVIETAHRFAEYIRAGVVPQRETEA